VGISRGAGAVTREPRASAEQGTGSALGHFRDGSERPTGNAGKGPLFLLENKKKKLKGKRFP